MNSECMCTLKPLQAPKGPNLDQKGQTKLSNSIEPDEYIYMHLKSL